MKIEEWLSDVYYDKWGTYIWSKDEDGGSQMVADIRGWGAIQNLFNTHEEAEQFQDEVGEFIVQAIKEKLSRLPQQEISDEEIEEEISKRYMHPTMDYDFRDACKWYREQLKSK